MDEPNLVVSVERLLDCAIIESIEVRPKGEIEAALESIVLSEQDDEDGEMA